MAFEGGKGKLFFQGMGDNHMAGKEEFGVGIEGHPALKGQYISARDNTLSGLCYASPPPTICDLLGYLPRFLNYFFSVFQAMVKKFSLEL